MSSRSIKIKSYDVCDRKGKVVFTGTADEIAQHFESTKNAVRVNVHYTNKDMDYWFLGKYKIYKTGEEREVVQKLPEPKKPEKETPYTTAVWALKTFGNTSVDFDPYPKLLPELLLNDGLDCRAEEKKDYPSKKITRRGKPKIHWYVEVVRAIERC